MAPIVYYWHVYFRFKKNKISKKNDSRNKKIRSEIKKSVIKKLSQKIVPETRK